MCFHLSNLFHSMLSLINKLVYIQKEVVDGYFLLTPTL